MAATAEQIAELRRKTAEPTQTPYDDAMMAAFIEKHPLVDELGHEPFYYDFTVTLPVRKDNPYWIATYDVNAAAADVWDEKASTLTQSIDFQADGASFSNSQMYQNALREARKWRAKSSVRTIRQEPSTGNAGTQVTTP